MQIPDLRGDSCGAPLISIGRSMIFTGFKYISTVGVCKFSDRFEHKIDTVSQILCFMKQGNLICHKTFGFQLSI